MDFANSYFTPEINQFRMRLRKDLEEHVVPKLPEMVESEACFDVFGHILAKHDCMSGYLQPPYGKGLDSRFLVAVILELGRIDASLATFHLVQNVLFANTIGKVF